MHPTSSPPNPGKARRIGWGATVVAFILGYLFWLVSREWWTPSLIVFGILFAAIVGLTCRLAITHRAYDLFLAALRVHGSTSRRRITARAMRCAKRSSPYSRRIRTRSRSS